jgi:hypothetical protein
MIMLVFFFHFCISTNKLDYKVREGSGHLNSSQLEYFEFIYALNWQHVSECFCTIGFNEVT